MRLIETDIERKEDAAAGEEEVSTPPRPEHRRAYVSFLFTFSVLVATVTAIYTIFPARDNEMITLAFREHAAPGPLILKDVSYSELLAWGVGVVGENVPIPEPGEGIELVGARALTLLKAPVAMVRYRVAGEEVSFFVTRPRSAPPRRFHRTEGEYFAVSWLKGRWRLMAVGRADMVQRWGPRLGAP